MFEIKKNLAKFICNKTPAIYFIYSKWIGTWIREEWQKPIPVDGNIYLVKDMEKILAVMMSQSECLSNRQNWCGLRNNYFAYNLII